MPLNLELKARVSPGANAAARAESAGALFQGVLRQTDTYFDVRSGRLKLRQEDGSGADLIYYERNEERLERWSQYWRIPQGDPLAILEALTKALGVLQVVRKERRLYAYRGARIHCDTVEGLGDFLEFEIPFAGKSEAEALMRELRAIFGIREEEIERHSYLDLLTEQTSSPRS